MNKAKCSVCGLPTLTGEGRAYNVKSGKWTHIMCFTGQFNDLPIKQSEACAKCKYNK